MLAPPPPFVFYILLYMCMPPPLLLYMCMSPLPLGVVGCDGRLFLRVPAQAVAVDRQETRAVQTDVLGGRQGHAEEVNPRAG